MTTRLLVLVAFSFLSSAVHAQDVRISPDPIAYILPADAQIQSAARIDSLTLAVWGTTALDVNDSVINVLRMQLLRDTVLVGEQRTLHSAEARPYGFVQVIAVKERFLVFWNDRRADSPGVYMRRVDTTGEFVGGEVRWDSLPVSANGFFVFPHGAETWVLWSRGDSSGRTFVVAIDPTTGAIIRRLPDINGHIVNVIAAASLGDAVILMRESGVPLVVRGSSDSLAPFPYPGRLSLPHHLGSDGALALIGRDTIWFYRSPFDALPYRSRAIEYYPRGDQIRYVENGATLISRNAAGEYIVMFAARTYVYTTSGLPEEHVSYFTQTLDSSDNFSLGQSVGAGYLVVNPSHWDYYEVSFKSAIPFFSCSNSSSVRLTYSIYTRTTIQGNTTESTREYEIEMGIDGEGKRIPLKNVDCWNCTGQHLDEIPCNRPSSRIVSRVNDRTSSRILVEASALVSLAASTAEQSFSISEGTPAVSVSAGRLMAAWVSPEQPPTYRLAPWVIHQSQPVENLSILTVSDIGGYYSLDNAPAVSLVRQHGNFSLISQRRWYEPIPGTERSTFTFRFTHFAPSDTGWIRAKSVDLQNAVSSPAVGYNTVNAIFDPNRQEWLSILQVRAVQYFVQIFAIDTSGVERWNIERTLPGAPFPTIIPLDSGEIMQVDKSVVYKVRGIDTVGSFPLPTPDVPSQFYRLFGPYFLRTFSTTPNTLSLQLIGLDGKLIRSGSVGFSDPISSFNVLQNPGDSAVILVWGKHSGVRATVLDRLLTVRYDSLLVSTTTDTVANPSATIRNDSLFAVWEDYRNGQSDIYGAVYRLPRVPASVAHDDATGEAFALTPNPAVDEVEITLASPLVDDGVITIINQLGRSVATREIERGSRRISLDIGTIPSGVYILLLQTGEERHGRGFVVIH